MIVVTGEIEFHPEDAWPAMAAALKMMEETAKEDGCIVYRFYSDIVNPRRFRVYEEWRDEAALAAHFETPHMKVFREKTGKLRVLERRLVKMKATDVTPI